MNTVNKDLSTYDFENSSVPSEGEKKVRARNFSNLSKSKKVFQCQGFVGKICALGIDGKIFS